MKRCLLIALTAGVPSLLATERPVLLPAVQKISYSDGSASVCRLLKLGRLLFLTTKTASQSNN